MSAALDPAPLTCWLSVSDGEWPTGFAGMDFGDLPAWGQVEIDAITASVDLAGLPGTDTTDHGAGSNGAPNTGDGGGSGSMNESVIPSVNFKGSDGGSGIVIVRCPMAA